MCRNILIEALTGSQDTQQNMEALQESQKELEDAQKALLESQMNLEDAQKALQESQKEPSLAGSLKRHCMESTMNCWRSGYLMQTRGTGEGPSRGR